MSSHEARTDVNLAFQWRFLAVPVTGRCTSQHFVLDSNGLRHHQKICLVAADGTLKLRFLRF
ncbi:hypothetical protein T01_862 [Trichinella spiralis]|uniref:Uncharacterized protein n=1 Tax=Trichinella spiralis TaxID=6334 RepID=A0A0V0Z1K3_TRISP|nr:hypothetical protein T01_862 [Trichinella spiralis]